ncbi:hypothetical protein ff3pr_00248 [Weissella cibaria]|nr:hypothetical protein ff3pr_00248 [Weissella cibaria]
MKSKAVEYTLLGGWCNGVVRADFSQSNWHIND